MVMEKHILRIVFVRGKPIGTIANISVVLSYHIGDHLSNRFKPFFLEVEMTKCCGTYTAVVDTIEEMNLQYLRETNAAIQTQLRCNRHQISISCLLYHTTNKRERYILELQMENMTLFTQLKTFRVITNCECFAYNRYMIQALHLHNKSKLQNSVEAENQVETIKKKAQLNAKLKETHSENFILRRRLLPKNVLLVIILLWQASITSCKAQTIQWQLKTNPVYFGRSVDLECIIQTEGKLPPMSWTKIPNGETIAYNINTRDIDKYAVNIEYYERKIVYNLTIKNFNSTDVNRVYRCDFGFESYAENLLLNENKFISEPSVKDVKIFSIKNRKLHGMVMINNGYPKPVCLGKFEKEKITKFMSIRNKNLSIFYETTIELDYSTDMCTGTVNVTCTYGNHTVLITRPVDSCSDSSESNHTTVYVMLATLAGFVFVSACVLVYYYRKYQQRRIPSLQHMYNDIIQNNNTDCYINRRHHRRQFE